jgi:hypothetical protein
MVAALFTIRHVDLIRYSSIEKKLSPESSLIVHIFCEPFSVVSDGKIVELIRSC